MSEISVQFYSSTRGNIARAVFDGDDNDWASFRATFAQHDSVKNIGTHGVEMPWPTLLALLPSLSRLNKKGVSIKPDNEARVRIKSYLSKRRIRDEKRTTWTEEQTEHQLLELGWKRKLRPPQLRDAATLLNLPHGANFSVPGAGKTTVTFAVHCLTANSNWKFLVVCPPNAFSAWEEIVEECILDTAPDWIQTNFKVVHGLRGASLEVALTDQNRIVTNYEHLIGSPRPFLDFLSTSETHLVVDESHRIKSGRNSERGRAILDLSDLPARKDILSGTPAPQSRDDFVSQFEFLWSDSKITQGIRTPGRLRDTIGHLYVRTTKNDLEIDPPTRSFLRVPMHKYQAMVYAAVRDEMIKQRMSSPHQDRQALNKLKRSVFTLLIMMTNPLAAIRRLEFDAHQTNNKQLLELLRLAAAEGHSSKIDECVLKVEELVSQGKKALVWTAFRAHGSLLEQRLSHLDPLPMHGGIPPGDQHSPNTREHNRHLFHGEDHNVMIANPAACSEGMSLHRVCHDAIYLDRTFNAAHYLQSIDRIHRLGLEPGTDTNITILQSTVSPEIPSVDIAVAHRMHEKIQEMNELLEDEEIEDIISFEYEASSENEEDADDQTFADKNDLYAALRVLSEADVEIEDDKLD